MCSQYLHKGSLVFIEGSLKPDARGNCRVWTNKDGDLWLDKDNQPRAGFELTAKEILFLNRVEGPNGEAGYEQVDLNTAADFA